MGKCRDGKEEALGEGRDSLLGQALAGTWGRHVGLVTISCWIRSGTRWLYVIQFSACYHGDAEQSHYRVGYARLPHDTLRSQQQNKGQFLLHIPSRFILAQKASLLAHDLVLCFNSSRKINTSKASPLHSFGVVSWSLTVGC